MTRTFDNGLTAAEEEMFQIAEEECAELIQAISKVRRFGRTAISIKTGQPYSANLIEEAADVSACLILLAHNQLIDPRRVNQIAGEKLDRLKDPLSNRVHFITPAMVP